MQVTQEITAARELLEAHLRPLVSRIDAEGLYPASLLRELGQRGQYRHDIAYHQLLIQEASRICCSTGFILWCQLMAVEYVRQGNSDVLKREVLPLLESGELLGGTGLSNPMKYYAGLEPLKLRAVRTEEGYRINGSLPFVSNLGEDHWVAVIFEAEAGRKVMGFLPCASEGLTITELTHFMGMNGTATYSCQFVDVEMPAAYVLSEEADQMVAQVRPGLVFMQTGMAFGVIQAAVEEMKRLQDRQGGVNQLLPVQPEDLARRYLDLRERADQVTQMPEIFRLRLDSAYLALDAAHAGMLHAGGTGYVMTSPASRRLREAYFFAVITPSIKQLEKVLRVK